ncbi:isopenicillin N synthase family dioxygenase [Mycobacterium simiae]|uniref:isopenicillin N synthase family dioxygenase n=1 Tax=Mycobacterium simiae TaxID=1784 RepID=UPI002636FFFE|nr:2-oxoglutarate and iron-dependent oxygenase domain-containing protein [Mycobacterium simiae]
MSGLTSFDTVPEIDISGLASADSSARAVVAQQLGAAAHQVGFMYVSGSGVPDEVFDCMHSASQRFFGQSMDAKMSVYIGNSTNHRGYVPQGGEVFAGGTADKKEAYDCARHRPDRAGITALSGPNQWPALPGFAEAVTEYYEAVFRAGRAIMRAFALYLSEPEDYFDRFLIDPPSQLRLIHYPVDEAATDSPGIGAHTDYECITLLKATQPGLEVLNGAGQWIDVPPRPGCFVVNIGDMLELWTNGLFVATTHRVRKVVSERYSYPLFFNVDYDTIVAPMPKLCAPGQPTRGPLKAGDHLFAQTAQSFVYLRDRIEAGELVLPASSLALSSFGHPAPQS